MVHSLNKIRDDVGPIIEKIVGSRTYKRKDHDGKVQEQLKAAQTLRDRYMNGVTLPNGILDKAVRFLGENVTAARKLAIEPKDPKVRLARWRDIVQSDVFFDIWTTAWTSKSDDAVTANPFPPHDPLYDYNQLLAEEQATDDTTDSTDQQLEPEGTVLRTCSSTFNNLIRREHQTSGDNFSILERIESVQLVITEMMHEVYTIAHMASILVSGYRFERCTEYYIGLVFNLFSLLVDCSRQST